ncbi:MAG: hypothetical protein ACXABY_06725, partial [Candidatus Thorarchaeota archaeon]
GEYLRGLMHFELDGSMVLQENHPNMVTWGSEIHWRVSGDTLGKRQPLWGERRNTGWFGYDDQHRSNNNLAVYLALTGDPMMEELVMHHLQLDRAAHKNRIGAPRAVGRLLLCWSHWYRLLSGVARSQVREVMEEKLRAVANNWRGGKHPNPVKVLTYDTDPRRGVVDSNGNPLPDWSVWEHGLATVGLYAAWKTIGSQVAYDILVDVCKTVIDYAVFEQAGRLWICDNVYYPLGLDEGKPIDTLGFPYSTTASHLNVPSGQGGTVEWTRPAVLIAIEILDQGSATYNKAVQLANTFGVASPITDTRRAEWWACVNIPDLRAKMGLGGPGVTGSP